MTTGIVTSAHRRAQKTLCCTQLEQQNEKLDIDMMIKLILLMISLSVAVGAMAQFPRSIEFSGYTWRVKRYITSKWGPGPNYFSDSECNVSVDSQGRLVMKIVKRNNQWHCAEVINTRSLGYGTYRFYLDSYVDNLDPRVVLGLFTWSDNPAYTHREIDIEFARFRGSTGPSGYYTVQPWDVSGRQHTFYQPKWIRRSVHSFEWRPGVIHWKSLRGHNPTSTDSSDLISQWTFNGANVPVPGDENPRINLWLLDGLAPTNGKDLEVIISKFEFIPYQP